MPSNNEAALRPHALTPGYFMRAGRWDQKPAGKLLRSAVPLPAVAEIGGRERVGGGLL